MARKPKVEALALFDAIAGLDTPPTDPDKSAAGDTTPLPLPEPTRAEAPAAPHSERQRRMRHRARPPAAAIGIAAILTAAVTLGLLTRPHAPHPPPRVTAATPVLATTPPPPKAKPLAGKPRSRPSAAVTTRPAVAKQTQDLAPPRASRRVVNRPRHGAPGVGSAVREFAP